MIRIRTIPTLLGLCSLFVGLMGCKYDPMYDGMICAKGGTCPPGYVCWENRCLLESEVPSQADAEDGVDAGSDPLDDGPANTDDAGIEADDDAGAPDGAADSADSGPVDAGGDEAGDVDPCAGSCPPGEYCDPADRQCKPCENFDHCGPQCIQCTDETQCHELNQQYCCVPDCSLDNICEQQLCGGRMFTCAVDVANQSAHWYPDDQLPQRACRWTPDPGPIPDGCVDDRMLRFRCPWDGTCQNGQCVWNSAIQSLHDCGESYGCDQATGQCRMHLKLGESCQYNYDCQSFCCSREQRALCIEFAYDSCKIFEGHEDGVADAFRAYDESEPHNMDNWVFVGIVIPYCDYDWECDCGSCAWDFGMNVCTFQQCVDGTDEVTVRSTYFCGTGDHQGHIESVTNPNPLPGPGSCP